MDHLPVMPVGLNEEEAIRLVIKASKALALMPQGLSEEEAFRLALHASMSHLCHLVGPLRQKARRIP
jgi:AmiR/NasT family two-component response regulator